MKNKKFLLIGIFVLAIVIIVLINLYPIISMKPTATGEIPNTEIFAIKNKINSLYFIKSGNGYILIDAGSDIEAIEKNMIESNIEASDIKYILLTHSDSDHVASLNLFNNATIYMSEDELQMINGTTKRDSKNNNSLPEGIEHEDIILLTDGEELILSDMKIKCIKAPGHTPGSMLYLVNENYLFSGDAIRVENNSIKTHPFSMDDEMSKNSIMKMRSLVNNTKLVLTAHYGYFESINIKE